MIWGPCPAQSPGTFVSEPRMAPFHQRGRLCSLVPLGMNTLGPCPSSKASLAWGTKPEVTETDSSLASKPVQGMIFLSLSWRWLPREGTGDEAEPRGWKALQLSWRPLSEQLVVVQVPPWCPLHPPELDSRTNRDSP